MEEKGNQKYKNLTRFHKEIRKEFYKLEHKKVFAEFIDEKKMMLSLMTELKTLLQNFNWEYLKITQRKDISLECANKLYS